MSDNAHLYQEKVTTFPWHSMTLPSMNPAQPPSWCHQCSRSYKAQIRNMMGLFPLGIHLHSPSVGATNLGYHNNTLDKLAVSTVKPSTIPHINSRHPWCTMAAVCNIYKRLLNHTPNLLHCSFQTIDLYNKEGQGGQVHENTTSYRFPTRLRTILAWKLITSPSSSLGLQYILEFPPWIPSSRSEFVPDGSSPPLPQRQLGIGNNCWVSQ